MTDFDVEALASWYREAMHTRMDELLGLRGGLVAGEGDAEAGLRRVGHALRGSGTSFGYPGVTDAGTLLEECPPPELLRRTDGALSILSAVVGEGAPCGPHAWLAWTNGVEADDLPDDLAQAWSEVADRAGRSVDEVAAHVATGYGVAVASLDDRPSPAAVRLVPDAVAHRLGVLPLRENGKHIVLATADPVSPTAEVELRRVTGREPRPAVAAPDAVRSSVNDLFDDEGTPLPEGDRVGGTVLIVDDDSTTRLIISATLERKGFRVIQAADGVEALERLQDGPRPDVAVVDLEMPRMGGRELLDELRADEEWAALPVVVLTGARDPQAEADLIEAGADDYIHKPLDPRLFLARVSATLRRTGR